jgi:hypothetical protein
LHEPTESIIFADTKGKHIINNLNKITKMEENKNQQPQGLQIELKPEIGVGVYANLALMSRGWFIKYEVPSLTCGCANRLPPANNSIATAKSSFFILLGFK